MQNNINNKPDAFSDIIRQRLENHTLPVDPNSWQEIEARLKSRKRIIPFWFWLSGGAAVAFLALLFTLRPLTMSNSTTGNATSTTDKHTLAQTETPAKHTLAQSETRTKNGSQTAVKTRKELKPLNPTKSSIEQTPSLPAEVTIPSQHAFNDSIDKKKTLGNVTDQHLNSDKELATESTGKDSVTGNRINSISLVEETDQKPLVSSKNKNSWLLAAAISSHGGVPTGNDKYNLSTGNNNIVSATTGFKQILTPNDFSNIIYTPPVSVGLVVRKNFNRFFGLESGLVYTYLLTTFENSATQRNDAKLHLHYIGIPLNLVVQLWNSPTWEIYMSGGGMVEKGIESVYVQHQYGGNQPITTSVTSKINGIQWSTNGAIGTTYKIQRNIGIYFEPKIAYYFDNNQPLSARTVYPVVIGFTAGVRFQFK